MTAERRTRRVEKPVVFILCLLPLGWLVWLFASGGLGFNPIEATNRYLGDWALRFLWIALAVTPVRQATGWASAARFRRALGLFAFFYACLHALSYVALDQFFAWGAIWEDIVKRTYITLGVIAFLLLLPLAATSTKGWVKRLGGRAWQRLHRLVYPAAILAAVHHWMMTRADFREPLIYSAILAMLLGWRVVRQVYRRVAPRARSAPL
jgi:methionine sulfoxide reductase heme-binding subunit